uniref:Uncharacterized protein n=1 Tax=Rhizophora mucronata TaxID=61149 RepID=A0A2P2PKR8_RHIMU
MNQRVVMLMDLNMRHSALNGYLLNRVVARLN